MARPKGAKNKKVVHKDPMLEEIIEQEVEFICPIRGKIKQKVKIKRMKKASTDYKHVVLDKDPLDQIDDDVDLYDETEDLED